MSLCTWTKSVAAGGFALPVLLAGTVYLSLGNDVVRWAAPVLALAFLAATGVPLVADLKHPERFYLIFTRHHRRSWLARGVCCASLPVTDSATEPSGGRPPPPGRTGPQSGWW